MFRLMRYALIFALGTVVGPIIIAAIVSAVPYQSPGVLPQKELEIGRLVAAYRAKLPHGQLFLTIVPPPDGKECGYDPNKVFPAQLETMVKARSARQWSDYEGYYALHQWRGQNRGEEFIAAIQEKMAIQLSRFEAGFLRRCIDATMISSFCMKKVERIGNEVVRFDSNRHHFLLAGGNEDRVVCGYVDGVAARKGLPLSRPFDQKIADESRNPY